MKVIKVTQLNDDGSVAFEGALGPNETQYVLEKGFNVIMQTGAEALEGLFVEEDEDEDESFEVDGPDTMQ